MAKSGPSSGKSRLPDGLYKARIYRPNAAGRSIWKQEISRDNRYVLETDPDTGRHREDFVA